MSDGTVCSCSVSNCTVRKGFSSLNTQDIIFALTSVGRHEVCGYSLIRTEHPKLLIFETVRGTVVFKRQTRTSNLDIFAYMNSKFVYVEKHIRTQINQLYHNIVTMQSGTKNDAKRLSYRYTIPRHFCISLNERTWIYGSTSWRSNSHNKMCTRRSNTHSNRTML